jgi:hypothetical protein
MLLLPHMPIIVVENMAGPGAALAIPPNALTVRTPVIMAMMPR